MGRDAVLALLLAGAPIVSTFQPGRLPSSNTNPPIVGKGTSSRKVAKPVTMSMRTYDGDVGIVVNTANVLGRWWDNVPESSQAQRGSKMDANSSKVVDNAYTFQAVIRKPLGLELVEDGEGGVIVSRVFPGGCAEQAGVQRGDRILATCATLGGGMWEKTTIDGVVSAITSRLIIADSVCIQLQRSLQGHRGRAPPQEPATTSTTRDVLRYEQPNTVLPQAPRIGVSTTVQPQAATIIEPISSTSMSSVTAIEAPVISAVQTPSMRRRVEDTRSVRAVDLLVRFGTMGTLEGMPKVWKAVLKLGAPDSYVYHAGMQALLRLKSPRGAIRLFNEMRTAGLKPPLPVFTTAIKAYGRLGGTAGAKGARETAIEVENSGIVPDPVLRNALIDAYARCGDLETAELVLRNGWGGPPDAVAWNTLLNAFARKGDVNRLQSGLSEMEASGLTPSRVTLTTVMKGLVAGGMTQEAEQLMLRIDMNSLQANEFISVSSAPSSVRAAKAPPSSPATPLNGDVVRDVRPFNTLLDGYMRQPRPDVARAKALFEEMKTNGVTPDIMTYSTFMSGLLNAGLPEQAIRAFGDMKDKGVAPNLYVYTTAIAAAAQTGNMLAALSLLEEMGRCGVRPNMLTFTAAMEAAVQSGNSHIAVSLFNQLKKMHLRPDAIACITLIRAHCAAGNPKAAFEAIIGMENVKEGRSRAPLPAYNEAIASASTVGDFPLALTILERLMATGYTPSETTSHSIVSGCVKQMDMRNRRNGGIAVEPSSAQIKATEGRIDYILKAVDIVAGGAQKCAHGVIYNALLQECLAAKRLDLAKEIVSARTDGYFLLGRSTRAAAEKLEAQVRQWDMRYLIDKGLPGSMRNEMRKSTSRRSNSAL